MSGKWKLVFTMFQKINGQLYLEQEKVVLRGICYFISEALMFLLKLYYVAYFAVFADSFFQPFFAHEAPF
jgi:hypothetical protein